MRETPDQSTSEGGLLAGLVIGALVGAAIALLYAPKPGKETREELLQRLDEVKERVDTTTQELVELAKVRISETKADLTQAIEATRVATAEHVADLRKQAGLE